MAGEPITHYPHKVYTRAKWADDWAEEENLFCDRCTFGSSSTIGAASFRWSFGDVMSYTEIAFASRVAKSLTDKYVKVEVTIAAGDLRTWHGIFVDDNRDYGGELGNPTNTTGEQDLLALELTYLLDRWYVDTSFCKINTGSAVEEREIERGIPFNIPGTFHDRRIQGNCDPDGEKGPVFAESLDGAVEWIGKDILDYLVGYHMPKDLAGDDKLNWTRAADASSLNVFKGVIDYHGASVFELLNMLMDRRRLCGWCVKFDTTTSTYGPEITPFTFNPTDITLPGGTSLPANPDQVDINESDNALIDSLNVSKDGSISFSVVKCRGERIVVCGTMDYDGGNGEIDKDWTAAQETAYETAASGDLSYAALRDDQKHNANHEFRLTWERVFRWFKVKPDKFWNWLPTTVANAAGKTIDLDSYYPAARLLPVLPLKADADYTIPSTTIAAALPADSRDDFLPPIAFALDASRYYYLDQLSPGDDADVMPETDGRKWGVSFRMRHDTLGFILDVHGGPQHLIALTDFTATDDADEVDFGADLDWKTFKLTVALETDNWAEGQWPETPSSIDDVLKELVIYIPGRRMEYVMADTAFLLDDDGSLKLSGEGWITDDSKELLDIARLAYEWYRRPRRTLTMTVRTLDCPYEIGQMITTVKRTDDADLEPEVYSVITQITWDLLAGSYTIKTQFGELDARAFGEL